jgi:hypothetical protein
MTKFLVAVVAALALTVAGMATYLIVDGGGSAEAHAPIDCNVTVDTSQDPDAGLAVCNGVIHVQTPFQTVHISFDLTVTFNDNDSSGGPSRGDEVTGCHLEVGPPVNFSGDVHRGPCP